MILFSIVSDQLIDRVPMPIRKADGAPMYSSCNHLVGLQNWQILSVSEAHLLIRGNTEKHKVLYVSIQVSFKTYPLIGLQPKDSIFNASFS